MEFHDHSKVLRQRFFIIFLGSFVVIFALLNMRYVYANVKFWIRPGTIQRPVILPSTLPIARDVQFKPLPDRADLVIDSIGVKAPLVFNVPTSENAIYKSLEQGVVHYSETVKPGDTGTAIVLGHSSAYPWYEGQYGSVFALLSKLKVGDRFYVRYEDNRFFVFQVAQSIVFNPLTDSARLAEIEQSRDTSIILVSCYPVGTTYQRIAIKADLVQQ